MPTQKILLQSKTNEGSHLAEEPIRKERGFLPRVPSSRGNNQKGAWFPTDGLVDSQVAESGALEVFPLSDVGTAVADLGGGPGLVPLPHQPVVQSLISQSIGQLINRSINQSVSQSINQSINQSMSHSIFFNQVVTRPV